jgi:hypothetical protein
MFNALPFFLTQSCSGGRYGKATGRIPLANGFVKAFNFN